MQLGLLEIGHDIDPGGWHHRHQERAGSNVLTNADAAVADDAIYRRTDESVGKINLRKSELRLGLLEFSVCFFSVGLQHVYLAHLCSSQSFRTGNGRISPAGFRLSDIVLLSADTLCDQQCRRTLKILVDSRPISFRTQYSRSGGFGVCRFQEELSGDYVKGGLTHLNLSPCLRDLGGIFVINQLDEYVTTSNLLILGNPHLLDIPGSPENPKILR